MALLGKKTPLNDRLAALREAARLGEGYLTDEQHAKIERVAREASERRELSGDHTVVGFFGATGSGKTSLFNAVVGEDLGKAAARRPTTSSPLAAVWHPDGSEELLDWLEVEDRRSRSGDFAKNAGPLILLDLPDFDSVELSNRDIAAKLVGKVDVLVWVTDPEKYADSVIHNDFIRPHASHGTVTLAVLNKADKLADADVDQVADSLRGLLVEDGLAKASVIPTSAKTGMGVDTLRKAIAKVASSHNAQQQRIEADLTAVSADWVDNAPAQKVPSGAKKEMDTLLAQAAGADTIADATAAAYRKRLGKKTGWVVTSWMLTLRADPLRRLGLREESDETGVHRTSMPELDASSKAVANRGVRGYAQAISSDLPTGWKNAVATETEEILEKVPQHLDRAVAKTKLPAQPSAAWNVFAVLQWLALLAALVGVGWYLVAAFLPGVLDPFMDDITPEIEGWPYPTLLIAGGVLLGIVLGLFTGAFGFAIGSGVRRRTCRALRREVAAVSAEKVEQPLLAVRDSYLDFIAKMRVAAGR